MGVDKQALHIPVDSATTSSLSEWNCSSRSDGAPPLPPSSKLFNVRFAIVSLEMGGEHVLRVSLALQVWASVFGENATRRTNIVQEGQNCSFPGEMSLENVVGDKSAESTAGPSRVHSRAVAAETQPKFDLRPHMESPDWTENNAGIQQHLQKACNTNKAAFKAQHWVIDLTIGTYNVEKIRRAHPENITASEWIRGKQRGHIPGVGRVLPTRATASPSTPAHESTLNILHKKVDFMMSLFKSDSKYSDIFSQFESGGASGSGGCGDDEKGADDQDDEDEDDNDDT
nr:F-box domain, leucine-rich repeat domain, L domain-like protein [Tanacetum cinerariifolium]